MTQLPSRNWLSLVLLLAVQALNAFNDNFVKILLIALAPVVAGQTFVGANMELFLGGIFSLPYVLFAPVAGWLSDRFSKKTVIVWMQAAQAGCFLLFIAALSMRVPEKSLWLSLAGFFLLASQAAFFSPAKMGIVKDLVGSRRLGMASGWLQMTMMAGTLGGMWAAGNWFADQYSRSGDAWAAALSPITIIAGVTLLQLLGAVLVQRTPAHAEVTFERSMLLRHFANVKSLFAVRQLRLPAAGIAFFWFLSNAISLIVVTLMKETYAGSGMPGDNARALAAAAAVLGVGIIFGSLVASAVCRVNIQLGLVPVAGVGFAVGLLMAGLAPLGSDWVYGGLVFTGFAGGCFMVPLYAAVQDRAHPSERGRVLAAINLLDCLAAIGAALVVGALKVAGLSASGQFIALVVPSLGAAVLTLRLRTSHSA